MTEPGRRNPSPAVGAPVGVGKAVQRWERLLRNGQCVGYRRNFGRAQMFSSDGYGWSAQPIEHDSRLLEASFGGGSLKVFHGDIVEMPYRYDDQTHATLVVFVTAAGEEFLFVLGNGAPQAKKSFWFLEKMLRLRRRKLLVI